MIPGTSLAAGGGGALSRDVGGSGNLQQSPLQYRGSGDTVQTVEGLRLNNLCGNGQYSGVYWNDGSFQEVSYVTGADSAEMGQGGMRVNMVPKDGGNTFRGGGRQLRRRAARQVASPAEQPARQPGRRPHVQPEQPHHQRRRNPGDLGRQSVDWRADPEGQALVQLHVPSLGHEQDGGRCVLRRRPLAFEIRGGHQPPRHRRWAPAQQRVPPHVAGDQQGQDRDLSRRAGQVPQPLGHRLERPARRVGRSRWSRSTSSTSPSGPARRATAAVRLRRVDIRRWNTPSCISLK